MIWRGTEAEDEFGDPPASKHSWGSGMLLHPYTLQTTHQAWTLLGGISKSCQSLIKDMMIIIKTCRSVFQIDIPPQVQWLQGSRALPDVFILSRNESWFTALLLSEAMPDLWQPVQCQWIVQSLQPWFNHSGVLNVSYIRPFVQWCRWFYVGPTLSCLISPC